jgi:hypothetical protein
MLRPFCLTGLMLVSTTGLSHTVIGNGGDVVVCRDQTGAIQSFELLDYYEGRELYNLPSIDFGDETRDPAAIAGDILNRLAQIDSYKAKQWQMRLGKFSDESELYDGVLTDIPDSNHIALPHGCELVQFAVT